MDIEPSFKIHPEVYTGIMKYEVKESQERPGAYLAVAVNEENEGQVYQALFSGPESQKRAEEYVRWKNSELEASAEELLRR